ncbi:MAG: Xaa-Pro peptidase family protein [Bifidobacteriaceae bacterium]|jgi:Xaa-Pro aminopeptidase|nr:Xaa-Pro peptidase family protein [Bifidobacteriaceae bacterium]
MAINPDYRLKWADFPADEYRGRVAKAQGLMAQAGLDLVVLLQKENVEYFSGFLTNHWDSKAFPTAAVVLHVTEEPILVLPGFLAGTAFSTSYYDRLRTFDEPHARPREFAEVLIAAVRELAGPAGAKARIGWERGPVLAPRWNFDDLLQILPALVGEGEILSAADVIWGCRLIKTPRELERLTWLTGVTDQALLDTFTQLRPGLTEFQVGTMIAARMMDLGAEGTQFRNIRAGADRYHCSDSNPTQRPLAAGDLLVIDIGAQAGGYSTDVAYTVLIGRPTDRHKFVWDVTRRAQDAAVALCRPGVPATEPYRAAVKVIAESGLPSLDMIGHSIGLDPHEPPMLDPYGIEPLQAGMFLSVEPWLYDPSGLGIFALEEHILVSDGGPVTISSVPRDELRWVEA